MSLGKLNKNKVNVIIGVLVMMISILVMWQMYPLPFMKETGPGPSFLPWILAVIMIVLAFNILSGNPVMHFEHGDGDLKQSVMYMVIFMLTLIILPYLGTTCSVLLFILAELVLVERRRLLISILVSLGTAAMIYIVFDVLFRLPLPHGVLGF